METGCDIHPHRDRTTRSLLVERSPSAIAIPANWSRSVSYTHLVTSWDNYVNQATADTTFSTGVDGWDDAKWVSPGETDYAVAMMRSPKQTIHDKAIKNAKLYMTALGDYKAYILSLIHI